MPPKGVQIGRSALLAGRHRHRRHADRQFELLRRRLLNDEVRTLDEYARSREVPQEALTGRYAAREHANQRFYGLLGQRLHAREAAQRLQRACRLSLCNRRLYNRVFLPLERYLTKPEVPGSDDGGYSYESVGEEPSCGQRIDEALQEELFQLVQGSLEDEEAVRRCSCRQRGSRGRKAAAAPKKQELPAVPRDTLQPADAAAQAIGFKEYVYKQQTQRSQHDSQWHGTKIHMRFTNLGDNEQHNKMVRAFYKAINNKNHVQMDSESSGQLIYQMTNLVYNVLKNYIQGIRTPQDKGKNFYEINLSDFELEDGKAAQRYCLVSLNFFTEEDENCYLTMIQTLRYNLISPLVDSSLYNYLQVLGLVVYKFLLQRNGDYLILNKNDFKIAVINPAFVAQKHVTRMSGGEALRVLNNKAVFMECVGAMQDRLK